MTDAGIIDLTSFLMGGVTGDSSAVTEYTALAYPINHPAFGVTDVTWLKDEVRGISESPFTLHRQIHRHAGERWRVQIDLAPMTDVQAGEWSSFLLLLDGGYGSFLFGDVFNLQPKGLAWGSPVVDGAAQTGKVLNTKGWEPNVEGILLAGDKIQIGSSLYQVLRNVNSDATGKTTLDIWPRIRTSPGDESTIITVSPKGLFQLAGSGGGIYSRNVKTYCKMASLEIIEAF